MVPDDCGWTWLITKILYLTELLSEVFAHLKKCLCDFTPSIANFASQAKSMLWSAVGLDVCTGKNVSDPSTLGKGSVREWG